MIITKITGAQCRMMKKKYTKLEKDSQKDGQEKLRTKPDRRTDRLVGGGIKKNLKKKIET